MSYCTIEEAWGNGSLMTNVSNKEQRVEGLPTGLASNNPSVNDLIDLKGGNNILRNHHTRGVHSRRSRNKRVKRREHNLDLMNLETDVDYKYLDAGDDIYSPDNTKSLMYNPMVINEEYDSSSNDTFGNLNNNMVENMPPYGGMNNAIEYENNVDIDNENINESVNTLAVMENDNNKQMDGTSKMLVEILDRLDRLERKMDKSEGNNIHDIILFILMGLFVLFILDSIFRIGRMTI